MSKIDKTKHNVLLGFFLSSIFVNFLLWLANTIFPFESYSIGKEMGHTISLLVFGWFLMVASPTNSLTPFWSLRVVGFFSGAILIIWGFWKIFSFQVVDEVIPLIIYAFSLTILIGLFTLPTLWLLRKAKLIN